MTELMIKSGRDRFLSQAGGIEKLTRVKPAFNKFWDQVDRSEDGTTCWLWMGRTDPRGFGVFFHRGRSQQAHRFSYENRVGPIPEGQRLFQLCKTNRCVNPYHLRPGRGPKDKAEFIKAFNLQNRQPPVQVVHPSGLSASKVRVAKNLSKAGLSNEKIAARFGVNEAVITDTLTEKAHD